jgi:hypothetical protein
MTKSHSAGIGNPFTARVSGTRRPPSTPANASSGNPSGSGITALTVSAGGPPTHTFTGSRSLRPPAAA